MHPEVRQAHDATMAELAGDFPSVAAATRVSYERRNNATFDPWEQEIKLPVANKDLPLATVDHNEDASNPEGYVVQGGGLRGTLLHEFGHAIDHHIIRNAAAQLKDEWFNRKRELMTQFGHASTYGARSNEWVPERFTAEKLGKAPEQLIPILKDYVARVERSG